MNLFNFLGRGAALAPSDDDRCRARVAAAAETNRQQWLNALLVDETRVWLSLGERQPDILTGLAVMLTIAGFVDVHASKNTDTVEQRVMRGAISASIQCSRGGSVVLTEHAQAFSVAVGHAKRIIGSASPGSIVYAAQAIRAAVGMPS